MITRRDLLITSASTVAGAVLASTDRAHAQAHHHHDASTVGAEPTSPAAETEQAQQAPPSDAFGYTPVVVPNGSTLPWKSIDGVKVFHLIAQPVVHEIAPGLRIHAWGYNGATPGPVIEAVEGDQVRIYVTNKLPEPTSVHWHGVPVPNGMDGVAGLVQRRIEPGKTFRYEFTLNRPGTFMYHPHFDEMVQMGLGMTGMFVVHPKQESGPRPDRDFSIMLSEWAVKPGTARPDASEMTDFNVLTMNSKAFPGTAPLVVALGQRVRIRLGNLGANDHHPIHLHGYQFRITETDGGRIPESGQWPETTVLVPVGTTRTIEFVADAPGDWAFHCHMTHHVMNQMGHRVPNMIGVAPGPADEKIESLLPEYMSMGSSGMGEMADMQGMPVPRNSIPMLGGSGPFGAIDMGGMFTVLKVREGIRSYEDPGWYAHPDGSVATVATPEELRRAGIRS